MRSVTKRWRLIDLLGRPAQRKPIVWMHDEGGFEDPLPTSLFVADDCPDCPWRCPECNSTLIKSLHDGWECLECGVVY